jgi:hypothetical protein
METKPISEQEMGHRKTMGEKLGSIYYGIWQQVASLHFRYDEYAKLFGTNQKRIDLINRVAPQFAWIVQDAMLEQVILHIAKLTDPDKTGKKENLSIRQFPKHIKDNVLRKSVEDAIEVTAEKAASCRDWRNRHIAHLDLDLKQQKAEPLLPVSRSKLKDCLKSISKVMNLVSEHYEKSTNAFDVTIGNAGAESLLYVLRDGLKFDRDRKIRYENKEFTDEDMFEEPL